MLAPRSPLFVIVNSTFGSCNYPVNSCKVLFPPFPTRQKPAPYHRFVIRYTYEQTQNADKI